MDEIEAKFTLSDPAVSRQLQEIDQLAGCDLGTAGTMEVVDTFFDTADRRVLAAGWYCRQRQVGGRPGADITLKALAGGPGAIHRREELNLYLPEVLVPTAWPAGPLRERLLSWTDTAALRPLFSLRQLRTTRLLLRAGQPVAELSVDQVELADGARRESFYELEVELAPTGGEEDLAAVVATLQARWMLQAQRLSKFERGLAFLEARPGGEAEPEGTAGGALEGAPAAEWGLTADERAICQRLARRTDLHGRRARALLALDSGATQVAVGRKVGMSERRVRYWQATFRQERLGIFPQRVLAQALPPAEGRERPAIALPAAPADAAQPEATPAGAGRTPAAAEREAEPLRAGPAPMDAAPVDAAPVDAAPAPVTAPGDLAPADVPPPEPAQSPGQAAPMGGPAPDEGLPAVPAGLLPDDTMGQAARKTVQRHLRQVLEHEAGVRLGSDIEEVHDMRVATRRLRAAMRVFGDHIDPERVATLTRDLRRAGRLLGTVRDMDVFREKAQRYLASLPAEQRNALDPLLGAWDVYYGRARAALVSYLDGARYAALREHMAAFLHRPEEDVPDAGVRPQRLRQVVPVALYQGLAAVRAYDEWLVGPQVPLERYHGLRIASKGLRYTLEFFRTVLGPEAAVLIERMKLLQDHLGDLHDAAVACGLLRDFLTWGTWGRPEGKASWPASPILAPGVAAYLAFRQMEIQSLVETFPPVWERVRGPEFARLLGISVMVLLG